MPTPKVLMIALDAGEPSLIERWTDDGSLPHLAALRRDGCYGRLDSSAKWLVGSPWPTFYTSTDPSDHGFYHYLARDPARMAMCRPTAHRVPIEPFWRVLHRQYGVRPLTLDVPLVYHHRGTGQPEYDGIEVNGYATHELLVPPGSHPWSLWRDIVHRFGQPPVEAENYALETPAELLRIRDQLKEASRRVGALGAWLMQRQPWNLGLIGFCALHRGGHKLWDETNLAEGTVSDADRALLRDALRQLYIACDEAVGQLIEEAGDDTTIVVFSVHGMGPNTCRTELLGEMLGRVIGERAVPGSDTAGRQSSDATGLSDRLRQLIPGSWRHAIKHRLPLDWQDRLTAFWRLKGTDFSQTRAIALPADLQGYIRVNLKGREAKGIVSRGREYEALCAQIEQGLRQFVDVDTGRPVVADVVRTDSLYPDGARRDALPDLLVRWCDEPVAATRRVHADAFGSIDWPTPGRNMTGRSGNHRDQGFVIMRGPGVPDGHALDAADIKDLAPTVCQLLGHAPLVSMRGRSLLNPAPASSHAPDAA